jgi:nucleoside-diphosphate-sugar epimerase
MSLYGGRVVVTGAAGFIGSHLVDRLLNKAVDEVIGFDSFSRGRRENLEHLRDEPRFKLIEGDVRRWTQISDALRGADLVYHLAAQSTVVGAARDPLVTFEANAFGTFNVLRAATQARTPRVIFASSRQVYGEPISLPVDEDSPLLAINSYAASKVAGEAYCRAFRREFGLQTVILRLGNAYGPRDRGRVIPVWLEQASAGQDLQVYGGKQVIDFVGVGTVVDALVRASEIDGPIPPINIGSGTGTRILDLARRIVRLADARPRIQLQPARPMDVTRFIANVERMRQILKIEPPLDPLANLAELFGSPVPARA